MTNAANLHAVRTFDLSDPSTLTLDLNNPKNKEVLALVEVCEADSRAHTALGPVEVKTGWNDITPALAVKLLRRNRPGANRHLDPATVFYYAQQMVRGEWKPTGQPMIIDENGTLLDAQHRLYAILVSGKTIKSFVVAGVAAEPGIFAYIDNSRPRSAATALQTAGFNGASVLISKAIKIAQEVEHGVYNPTGATKLGRMSPADVLHLATSYPNAQKGARLAASADLEDVVKLIGNRRKDVLAYLAMVIIDNHGEDCAEDFFDEVMDDRDRLEHDPILALRKLAEKDLKADKEMKRHHMLAAMIKVFNAWKSGTPLGRRWMLQVNEDFPELIAGEPQLPEADEDAA